MFHLNAPPSREQIEDIATELSIDPAFIEKDWYAIQLLAFIAYRNKNQLIKAVFSGGTSLSKGHKIIKRFSEDLDFILINDGREPAKSERTNYREGLVNDFEPLKAQFEIVKITANNESRKFTLHISYPAVFPHASLRPHLQIEMIFSELRAKATILPMQSIVSSIIAGSAETEIACTSPIEIAADKLSALTWRILADNSDRNTTRHLHDLAALKDAIVSNKDLFKALAKTSLEQDRTTRGGELIANMNDTDRLQQAATLLAENKSYRDEYETFVTNMSYAEESEKIHFDQALIALKEIIAIYLD